MGKAKTFIKKSLPIWMAHLLFSMVISIVCVFSAKMFIQDVEFLFTIYTVFFFLIIQVSYTLIKADPRTVYRDAVSKFTQIEEDVKFRGVNKEVKTILRIQADNMREDFLKRIMSTSFMFSNFYNPENDWERVQEFVEELLADTQARWIKKGCRKAYVDLFSIDFQDRMKNIFLPKVREMLFTNNYAHASSRRIELVDVSCQIMSDSANVFMDKIDAFITLCRDCQHDNVNTRMSGGELSCAFNQGMPCTNFSQK